MAVVNALMVVETEDDHFLGFVEFVQGGIVIRTGFRGHPKFVSAEELTSITLAHDHSLVTV